MLPLPPHRLYRPAMAVVAVAAALAAPAARVIEPFVLQDIRVEGLQRTDPGTVFAALPFRVGDTYSDDKGAMRRCARCSPPACSRTCASRSKAGRGAHRRRAPGHRERQLRRPEGIRQGPLIKSLKDSGIGEGLPFDRALIDRAEQEIKRQYLSRSLYGAEVVTTITPIERNRVNVTFTMTEGEAAKIKEIRIVGAKAFKEATLLGLFDLTTGGWLTWYTKSDRYSRAKLNADLETLRAHYVNRGYLEFAVESTQVTISPDKQEISITISVKRRPALHRHRGAAGR
jgi:outer membrane protein insertion porin family